jgi:hypothetical protein
MSYCQAEPDLRSISNLPRQHFGQKTKGLMLIRTPGWAERFAPLRLSFDVQSAYKYSQGTNQ